MGKILFVIAVVCLLVRSVSSVILCQEDHHGHGLSLVLDSITTQAFSLGFSLLILYFAIVYCIFSFDSSLADRNQSADRCEPKPKQRTLNAQSACKNDVLFEYPLQRSASHIVFQKTGVEVIEVKVANGLTLKDKWMPRNLMLQACTEAVLPDHLQEDELPLSPVYKFVTSAAKLDRLLEVWIPHGANIVLTGENWSVILKEYVNHTWLTVGETSNCNKTQESKNFVCKSNHVRLKTDHLSTFKITGKFDTSQSTLVFKRMKVVAFCNETRVGDNLIVRLYCFDDCEWSFERMMQTEQKNGGRLMSSIESVSFSVTGKKDVDISVKDPAGWHLNKASPLKFSYDSLRNSFNVIPRCDLVFKPCRKELSTSIYLKIVLSHEPSDETMIYASSSLKQVMHGNFPTVMVKILQYI
ncbi:uncharacterized protein LOC111337448 isoform X2 [Stylophora pistillata]|uniref:uncharacterized protein LOC111337448 isoform X2 n=1 Tax=Stylophora pistillata TaxID=50429 RepID=UPI000C045828|nr:uncharacterized protein LOC111337448 isoform X2 [Stylophora pistillata]